MSLTLGTAPLSSRRRGRLNSTIDGPAHTLYFEPYERRQKLIDDYKARFANPYSAAERGYIYDVIVPHETRPKLIRALETLQTKRVQGPKRKHGNIPL